MLQLRSNSFKLVFSILLVVGGNGALGQEYDVHDGHDGEYRDDYGGVDYSKYYSHDAITQPKNDGIQGAGFVPQAEFSNFFSPTNFEFGAASNQQPSQAKQQNGFVPSHELESGFPDFRARNPFASNDYFEKSVKSEDESDEVRPGPSYISHKIVTPKNQNLKSESELSDLNKDYKNYNHDEEYKSIENNNEGYPQPKIVDPKYLPQYKNEDRENLTPYQKYSFQPYSGNNQNYQSTNLQPNNHQPAHFHSSTQHPSKYQQSSKYQSNDFQPIKYQPTNQHPIKYKKSPTEYSPKYAKNTNCKKVNKKSPFKGRTKREQMECYVCKNPKTNQHYEECSYGAESKPQHYYTSKSHKYTQPYNEDYQRYKRYTVSNTKEDPYEYFKTLSQQYHEQEEEPEDKDKEEYTYEPEEAAETEEEERSASEKQSEEIAGKAENCVEEYRDSLLCKVCKNSKTGGSYESCSYTSKPADKKYAYVQEKKYNSDNDEDYDEEKEGSEEKPIKRKGEKGRRLKEVEKVKPYSTNKPKPSKIRYEKPLKSPESDTYYFKHFPDYSKEESQQQESKSPPDDYAYYGDGNKKDVEEVLAEFAKKDRSTCKKAEKNGLTCYLCTDKKGVEHEECMYVSESRPQSKLVAYHAAKTDEDEKDGKNQEFKIIAEDDEDVASSEQVVKTEKPDRYRSLGEEGAFADETKPVFSKILGFSVPKFMLTKSEGEKIYDKLVKS